MGKFTLKFHPLGDAHKVQWTNATGSAVAAGDPVDLGACYGVAQADIASGATGTVLISGVFEIAKATHATTKAFVAGELVVYDTANSRADKAGSAGLKSLGTAFKSAASTAGTMFINLNGGGRTGCATVTVDSTMAALNSNDGRVDINTGLPATPQTYVVMVLTSSTGVVKSGHKISSPSAGVIRIDGVAAGVQLDAGDIVHALWHA